MRQQFLSRRAVTILKGKDEQKKQENPQNAQNTWQFDVSVSRFRRGKLEKLTPRKVAKSYTYDAQKHE